jgi:endoglucanase
MAFALTPDWAVRNYIAPDSSGVATGTTGNDDIFATGNGQTLVGNGGDDIFHLGTYSGDQIVVPADGSGIDEVSTYTASYTLPVGVDNLAAAGDYGHTLIGNDGDNVIIGAGGDDVLMGGGGSDWLMGGAGNDVLYGGPGPDVLDGGSGSNQFVITANNGNQDIENFQPGPGGDVVDLANYGFTGFDQVRADMTTDTSSDGTVLGTFLHLPNGETLTFNGFDPGNPFTVVPGPTPDQFTAENFVFTGASSGSPPPSESQHTLTVYLAEDAWNGDAQFTLDVDGTQIFGPTPVAVKHGDGFQEFTFTGPLPDAPDAINVHFINDAWGGSPDADRNLYVGGVFFDGFFASGETAQNDAMNGQPDADPRAAEMYVNGTVTFADITQGPPGHPPPGDVPMTLHLSEDAWNGDAQFTVDIDGQNIIGPTNVAVTHSSGNVQDFTLYIGVGPGTHTLSVNFTNDAWGGTPDTDRNLYVNSVDINGVHFQGNTAVNNAANGNEAVDPTAAVMDVNGTATFAFDQSQIMHSTAPPEIMG